MPAANSFRVLVGGGVAALEATLALRACAVTGRTQGLSLAGRR